VYVTQPLPLPTRPLLPTIRADELQCLSPDVSAKLRVRNREQRQYAEELETIILSTHKK
jgi:hypothetical protein